MKGVVVFLVVLAVIVGAFASKGNSKKPATSAASSSASVSSCSLHGKTVLTGIPADASRFQFEFIGGGFTGHSWHTDWLPNDTSVRNGTFWIYTLGDNGTNPTGVSAKVQMSDGSVAATGLQDCY